MSLNQHGAGAPIQVKLKTYTLFTIIQSLSFVFPLYSCEKCIITFKFPLWYDDSIYGQIIRNNLKKSKLSFVKLFCDHSTHATMDIRSVFVQLCDQNRFDCRITDKINGSFNLRKHIALSKLSLFHIFSCLCNRHG